MDQSSDETAAAPLQDTSNNTITETNIPQESQPPPTSTVQNEASVDDDDEDMPPLEDIVKEELNAPAHGKKIRGVATEDDPTGGEQDSDQEDDLEVSKDGWIDILNNGDLRKKILVPAENANRPQRGAKVVIRLVTRLYEDVPAGEGSAVNEPTPEPTGPVVPGESHDRFSLVVGDNDLHQGLDLLLPLMDLGETARLLIKSRFGYGPSGNKAVGIPEDTVLDLEVQLLEIVTYDDDPLAGNPLSSPAEPEPGEPNPVVAHEPLTERIRFGNYKKTRGNFWFERGEYSSAIQCYRGAIRYLDASEEELELADRAKRSNGETKPDEVDKVIEVEDLLDKRAQTYNNLAAAQLKMQAYESALKSVEASLLLRPDNVKALYRRAKIRTEAGHLEDAIADLKAAAGLDPNSEAIAQELDRLNKVLARQLKEQRQMYRRMMQFDSNSDQSSKDQKGTDGGDSSPNSSGDKQQSKSKGPGRNSSSSSSKSSSFRSWLPTLSTPTVATLSTAGAAVVAALLIPTLYNYLK